MILYMILLISHEMAYDIIVLALLARPKNYDIIRDILLFGMISYMISMTSFAF